MGTIVVGVDGSQFALFALRWALREALVHGHRVVAAFAWDSPTSMLSVYGPGVDPVPLDDAQLERLVQEGLEAAVAQALRDVPEAADVPIDLRSVRDDKPANALIDLARWERADHIVVGTRGQGGLKERLLGSTSSALAQHAPAPVTLVPPEGGAAAAG
jgi:nucleotide-binding universal stress UspA family protein